MGYWTVDFNWQEDTYCMPNIMSGSSLRLLISGETRLDDACLNREMVFASSS